MKLIDAAIGHFAAKTVRSIEVPEWGVTLYSKNLSLEDRAKWITRSNGNATEYMVYAVIFGLTDDKGDAVFDIGDKPKLLKSVDPDIVSRLSSFVLEQSANDEKEREKN